MQVLRARLLCLILAGAICAGRSAGAQGQAQSPFPDMPAGDPAFEAVNELAKQGILVGYADSTIRADRPMTRCEVAAALTRLLQQPLRRDPPITVWPAMPILGPAPMDVTESHWAAQEVAQLREWGIIGGYPDRTFRGDRPVTRGEFSLILARLHEFVQGLWDLQRGRPQKTTAPILRLPAAEVAGRPTPVDFRKELTRGRFALILYGFLRQVEKETPRGVPVEAEPGSRLGR